MREQLAATLGDVFWSDLQAHAARDALIVVAAALDLLDVGEAIARNETARVEGWIRGGQLAKPTADELLVWPTEPLARFTSLVVAPYVLIQPITRPRASMN